jgi:UDP-3-O-[3-hydroxymyristoyl] glucosamine N-acyltransferase
MKADPGGHNSVRISDIAAFLGQTHEGPDQEILAPADITACGPGTLVWLRRADPTSVAMMNRKQPALVICNAETAAFVTTPHIVSLNPRLDFARAVTRFFVGEPEPHVHPTAMIEPGAQIGERVGIGAFVRIGRDVVIGDECRIDSGVAFEGHVISGKRCRFKANAVIGDEGFGFERDENGTAVHFPHLGSVVIEDDVWIGACTCVERAALGTTHISCGVKIDDLVQIGHNSCVGRDSLIMANSVICGGAQIGERCWIAPNSVIREKVRVGDQVTVGLGAVVLHDVPADAVVAGVPAKPIRR